MEMINERVEDGLGRILQTHHSIFEGCVDASRLSQLVDESLFYDKLSAGLSEKTLSRRAETQRVWSTDIVDEHERYRDIVRDHARSFLMIHSQSLNGFLYYRECAVFPEIKRFLDTGGVLMLIGGNRIGTFDNEPMVLRNSLLELAKEYPDQAYLIMLGKEYPFEAIVSQQVVHIDKGAVFEFDRNQARYTGKDVANFMVKSLFKEALRSQSARFISINRYDREVTCLPDATLNLAALIADRHKTSFDKALGALYNITESFEREQGIKNE